MFIVKRPFKNLGVTYTAGSEIVEPATIKRFKGKLAEGKIIEVTEQTYDDTAKYFKSKFGVDIPKLNEEPTKQDTPDTPDTPEVKQATKAPVKKAVAKAK